MENNSNISNLEEDTSDQPKNLGIEIKSNSNTNNNQQNENEQRITETFEKIHLTIIASNVK